MLNKAVPIPRAEAPAAPGGVAAVDRAVSLLDAFTPERPLLTLAELAAHTQQYKSTVLRLLASLTHAHVVQRHPDGRFGLGSAIPRLHAVYAASYSIEAVVMPALRELVAATRESAAFHVRQGQRSVCLYGVESPQPVRDHVQTGSRLPLDAGVVGRVFMAYGAASPEGDGRLLQDRFAMSPVDVSPEVAAIAAPVFDAGGQLAGVIALTMPAMRLQTAHAPQVVLTAQRLTEALGGRFPAPGKTPGPDPTN